MRCSLFATAIFLTAALLFGCSIFAADPNLFQEYSYLDSGNNILLPGRLFVPDDYTTDPAKPRPLIMFLHGSGEGGTNNTSQVNDNIDGLLAATKARGAFLYAPQTNIGWSNSALLDDAMSMIDRAIVEMNVDANRIYVTGLSMGGGGSWNFLNRFPDRVAATVPICGGSPYPSLNYSELLDEPIWAFHGRFDSQVPVTVTRNIINTFLTLAGQPIPTYRDTFGLREHFDFPPLDLHYTDYNYDHGIWNWVYTTPKLYDWMFAHGVVPEPGVLATIAILCGWLCPCRRRSEGRPRRSSNRALVQRITKAVTQSDYEPNEGLA
jgi:predicted peptidase